MIQLFVTGPALRRFGVGVTILLLPIALAFGSMLTLIWPGLLFVVVDQRLRPGVALLDRQGDLRAALSAAADRREDQRQGRHRPDGQPAGGRVGGILLGIATQGFSLWLVMLPGAGLGLRGLAAITAVLALVWVGIAVALRRGYVQAITDSIHQYRLDVERASAPVLDRSVTAALVGTLESADPEAILYALTRLRAPAPSGAASGGAHAARSSLWPGARARAGAPQRGRRSRRCCRESSRCCAIRTCDVRTEALLYLAYHARIDPLERIQ